MVLNIAKYQLPTVEYNLCKNYIAKNLCVKKEIKGNCCQGKCFVKKQIALTNEQDSSENSNNSNKRAQKSQDVNDYEKAEKIRISFLSLDFSNVFPNKPKTVFNVYIAGIFVPPKAFGQIS
jgi:hypothetical protein